MARAEKSAVVDEISAKLTEADAAVLTEYRGLTVGELADLRAALRPADAEYKVFKNTLARRGAEAAGLAELVPMLEGPVAIAFVRGDAVIAAKALRDFAKDNPDARREGRAPRRDRARRRRRSPRWPTCQPREVLLARLGRRIPGPARQGGRPLPGVHPQLRLRRLGLHRSADRSGRGPPRRRARGPRRAERPTPKLADAEAEPEPDTRTRTRSRRDRERERVMATPSTTELLDVFKNMTVLELNEFLKAFEEEFGVTAAAPVAVAAAGGGGGGEAAAPAEEKDEFDVILSAAGDKKIQVIKEVREPHQPRAEGSEGPGRRRAEARAREGDQGRRREGEGGPRGRRRHRRAQVSQGSTLESERHPSAHA